MKYWAFLSYSHSDRKWADWLHRALETYPVPRRLIGKDSRTGKIPARLFPIFRDREELPVSSDLGSNIEEALRNSRYLIVICSPRSAQSRWVGEEIKNFKRLGREDRILALIVDGEPNASDGKPGFSPAAECFPEAMRYRCGENGGLSAERTEPIAADARDGKDGKNNAKLKLLAGLLGVNYDDLKQREQRRVFRRRILGAFGALVILGSIAGIWTFQEIKRLRVVAEEQRRRIEIQEEQQRVLRGRTSEAYFNEALGLIAKNDFASAFAYLAGAVRFNPGNRAAVFRLTALFAEHSFWTPVVKPMRQRDVIYTLGFRPDQKRLLTGAKTDGARIWDAVTGEPAAPPLDAERDVLSAVFNKDGSKVLTSTGHVWDAITGRLLKELFESRVNYTLLSRNGDILINPGLTNREPVAQILETATGRLLATADTFRFLKTSANLNDWRLSLSDDGAKLLIAGLPSSQGAAASGAVALWDIFAGRLLWGPISISSLSHGYGSYLTQDGQYVILITSERTVELRNARNGKLKHSFSCHGPVVAARLSPDAKTIVAVEQVAGNPRQTIRRWKLSDAQQNDGYLTAIENEGVRDLEWWALNENFLEVPSGVIRSAVDGQEQGRICDRDLSLSSVQFSPDGRQLLTGSALGKVRLWHARALSPRKTTLLNGEKFTSFSASRNGHRLVAWTGNPIGGGAQCRLLDGETFLPLSEPVRFPGKLNRLVLSPNGKAFAVAVYEGDWKPTKFDERGRSVERAKETPRMSVLILDGDHGKAIAPKLSVRLSSEEEPVLGMEAICWSADSSKVAINSTQEVLVYDIPSRQMQTHAMDESHRFISAQFSPEGKHLYIFDEGGVSMWKLGTDQKPSRLITSPTDSGTLSPDGKTLALATHAGPADTPIAGSFQFWTANDGKPIGGPIDMGYGEKSHITSLAFSPDSKRVVAATWAGVFRIWDATTATAVTESVQTGRISSAIFIENGDVIMTTTKTGVDFWGNDGRRLAEHIETSGNYPEAAICANGNSIIFMNDQDRLMTRRMPARFCDAPEWAGDLAEAIGGWHLDDGGLLVSIEDTQPERLDAVFRKLRSSPPGSLLRDWAMATVVP